MTNSKTPPVAITLGDPAGIGPRIIFETCSTLISQNRNFFFLIADFCKVKPLADKFNCPVKKIKLCDDITINKDVLAIYDYKFNEEITPGVSNPSESEKVLGMIDKAVELILEGRASAMVTGPINKELIASSCKINFTGHTEYLTKKFTSVKKTVMMMQAEDFRVVPLTQHIPLKSVPKYITKKNIKETAYIVSKSLKEFWNIKDPKIYVSGLNPHSGENGTIGREEVLEISPALKELRSEGINVSGPFPADSLFNKMTRKKYDVAICMYHDQALIPIKSIFFDSVINVTLGLPIVRTSPGHGTAFDIVGSEKVNINPFKASLIEAERLAKVKKRD